MKYIITGLLLIFFALNINAQAPDKLSWQGILSDDQGDPLDGAYDIEVKIYNSETGGTALWSETHGVIIENGHTDLVLGKYNTLNLDFEDTYWLELTIDNGTPLSRVQLTSVPYAMHAKNVADEAVSYSKLQNASGSSGTILKWDGSQWIETTESDPVYSGDPASSITNTDLNHWNSAYLWGDHSTQGYISSGDAAGGDLTGTYPNPFIASGAIALDELSDAKTDSYSIFIGNNSGGSDNGTNSNVAVGHSTLENNVSGYHNVAVGYEALQSNDYGIRNIGIGYNSMINNTSGDYNTGIGYLALNKNTTSRNNVALGARAMYYNTTGENNIALGYSALYVNTDRDDLTAVGYEALRYNGTDATASIHSTENTALGYYALHDNTTGYRNTSAGYSTLNENETGRDNSAFGANSMESNTSGNRNTAIGSYSLRSNTSGSANIAIGYTALNNNTNGFGNIAIGLDALYNNNGSTNVSIGENAMKNTTTGYDNVGIGEDVMLENTTGYDIVAIGDHALNSSSESSYTVAIGSYAGGAADYTDCVFLGYSASGSSDDLNNSMALGYNSHIISDNQIRIGNYAVTSIGGYSAWTDLSDARFKENVNNDVPGIDFISKLRPVSYNLDIEKLNGFLNIADSVFDDEASRQAISAKESIKYSGFIAQEVEEAAKSIGYDFSGVDKPGNENDHYGLRYSKFVVPLVKAVQEQQEIIKSQKAENEQLKNRVNDLEQKYEELRQMIESR